MISLQIKTAGTCLCQGFMRLVDATGAEPYIVLNLAGKSGPEPPESMRFNSSQLKARMRTLRNALRLCNEVCKHVVVHCAQPSGQATGPEPPESCASTPSAGPKHFLIQRLCMSGKATRSALPYRHLQQYVRSGTLQVLVSASSWCVVQVVCTPARRLLQRCNGLVS